MKIRGGEVKEDLGGKMPENIAFSQGKKERKKGIPNYLLSVIKFQTMKPRNSKENHSLRFIYIIKK